MPRALLALALLFAATAVRAQDSGRFDVLSYGLTLGPEVVQGRIDGWQTIRLRLRAPATDVDFTDNALGVTLVEADGAPAEVRRSEGRLVVVLPKPGPKDAIVNLRLRLSGRPKRGLIVEPGLVYTSYFACDWMVCDQERPGDKARLSLKVDLPNGWRLLRGVPRKRDYSAYLFGFAATTAPVLQLPGRRNLQAVASPERSGQARRLLAPTADMAAFFEEMSGVSLPARPYWQVVSAAPEAQEGAGFAVLGRSVLEPMLETPSEDWAIAHELSHQWWGNLVTCRSWQEMWLNEGFATFMTAAWKERRWGRAAFDREMEIARRRLAAAAVAGFDKPLAWAGTYPSLSMRRAVQYSKGALFLDALRSRLGEERFWAAIRLYTRRHAGGVVTSRDFEAAVQAVAPGRADDLFQTWVFGVTSES